MALNPFGQPPPMQAQMRPVAIQADDRADLALRAADAATANGAAIADRTAELDVAADRIAGKLACGACVADEAPTLIWATDATGARMSFTPGSEPGGTTVSVPTPVRFCPFASAAVKVTV